MYLKAGLSFFASHSFGEGWFFARRSICDVGALRFPNLRLKNCLNYYFCDACDYCDSLASAT